MLDWVRLLPPFLVCFFFFLPSLFFLSGNKWTSSCGHPAILCVRASLPPSVLATWLRVCVWLCSSILQALLCFKTAAQEPMGSRWAQSKGFASLSQLPWSSSSPMPPHIARLLYCFLSLPLLILSLSHTHARRHTHTHRVLLLASGMSTFAKILQIRGREKRKSHRMKNSSCFLWSKAIPAFTVWKWG